VERLVRLEQAAQLLGVHAGTLRRWGEQGKIRLVRTPGGWRKVPESELQRLLGGPPPEPNTRVLAVYGRVSSHEQKARGDLERQVAHIRQRMEQESFDEVVEVTDVASGLSDKRKGLARLMALAREGDITDLAVTYKDRLTRFGFGYLEQFFAGYGVRIHVVDGQEDKKSLQEELVDDLIAIVTSFSGKLYGVRSHSQARALVKAVKAHVDAAGATGSGRRS
jgi:putative resolvase